MKKKTSKPKFQRCQWIVIDPCPLKARNCGVRATHYNRRDAGYYCPTHADSMDSIGYHCVKI